MNWQQLAGISLWCSLATVQVMPCGRENTAYTRLVHQLLAANVVLAEQNWCGHVASCRAWLVLPHAEHAVTVQESMLGDQLCYVSFEKPEPRNERNNVKKTPSLTVTQQLQNGWKTDTRTLDSNHDIESRSRKISLFSGGGSRGLYAQNA